MFLIPRKWREHLTCCNIIVVLMVIYIYMVIYVYCKLNVGKHHITEWSKYFSLLMKSIKIVILYASSIMRTCWANQNDRYFFGSFTFDHLQKKKRKRSIYWPDFSTIFPISHYSLTHTHKQTYTNQGRSSALSPKSYLLTHQFGNQAW